MLNCGSGIASFILTKSKMPQFDVGIVLLLLALGFVVLTRVFPIVGNVVQPLLDRPVPWMDRVCVSRSKCGSDGWTLMHLLLYAVVGACGGFKWRYLLLGAAWEGVETLFGANNWCDILWNTLGLAVGSAATLLT